MNEKKRNPTNRRPRMKYGSKPRRHYSVRLSEEIAESLKSLGDDNLSLGIDRMHGVVCHMGSGDSYEVAIRKELNIIQ